MAKWERTLQLQDIWKTGDAVDLVALAEAISNRLKALKDFGIDWLDATKEELVEMFESFDESESSDDFDSLMSELYDWGDTQLDNKWPPTKVCWIETT